MKSLKDELFEKLVQKTKELGRRVSFSEMRDDPSMPEPNQFAFYFGSFANAAEKAFGEYVSAEKIQKNGGDVMMSKRKRNPLSEELTKQIVSEIVDMYIAADGKMPGKREIKKNPYISEKQVVILRQAGELNEVIVRKLAEEKTGRKFLDANARAKQEAFLARQKRLALIGEVDNKKAELKVEEAKESELEEVEKMAEKERKPYRNWTVEEIKSALRGFYDAKGCLPTDKYLKTSENLPTTMTIKKHLGNTREEWLKAIGVEASKVPEAPETSREPEVLEASETSITSEVPIKVEELDKIEREIIDLIGKNGKLKQLGDMSDLMSDIKIEKQFYLQFGRIRVTVNVFATIDE